MSGATILVVDDDQEIAELVDIYLSNDGYNVLRHMMGKLVLKN